MAFDCLAYIDCLKAGGIGDEQARAHSGALQKALCETVATKGDIGEGTEIMGRFFIAMIAHAAQERAPIPDDRGAPHLFTSTRRRTASLARWRPYSTRPESTRSAPGVGNV